MNQPYKIFEKSHYNYQKSKYLLNTANLALDLRKYLNKIKSKANSTAPSQANIPSNTLIPASQQKNSQTNLQQPQQQVDNRQTRKGEHEQLYRQQAQQQQNNHQAQQNKNTTRHDEQQLLEQQRQQQNHAMQLRQQQQLMQQQQMLQQQQLEQQMKQQSQLQEKQNLFRRQQELQDQKNTQTKVNQQSAFQEQAQSTAAFGNANKLNKGQQKITEQYEEEEQQYNDLKQQSIQNQQVEVHDHEENSLQNRLNDDENEDELVEDEQQDVYDDEDEQEEYSREEGDQSHGFQSQQYSQQQYSQQKPLIISDSAVITQHSQELTPGQQHHYMQNFENQSQSNYYDQQHSSQIGRRSVEEDGQVSQRQVQQAMMREQQRIQQQDAEMTRALQEREQMIQQAIDRTEQSHISTQRVDTNQSQEQQQRGTQREDDDSEVHEEFFDHINDLQEKDNINAKPNLIKLGSFQRGNSYQMADDPVTPMNHPVHMDSDVQRAPVKHRMEEISEQMEDDGLNKFKRQPSSNIKKKYSDAECSDVKVEKKYHLGQIKGEDNKQKIYTQESGSKLSQSGNKFNQSAQNASNYNSVRRSNEAEVTTEFIQHNFEAQMEKAYFDKQNEQSNTKKSQNNNIFPEDNYVASVNRQQTSTNRNQSSAEKQQFTHMNLFNNAVSGFTQDHSQGFSGKDQAYNQKQVFHAGSFARNDNVQYAQTEEVDDDSCSINFDNEKVELKYNVEEMYDSARDSNLQIPGQNEYVQKSQILKEFQYEHPQALQQSYNFPNINVANSTTLNVVQKTYDNYYPERVTIDITGGLNTLQKKTTPGVSGNIFSTPSQNKYGSIGLSQESHSGGKAYSQSILPPNILKSPAFRREYLRGTADPAANRDRVTSVISPSRDQIRLSPSLDPIKRKYNHLFTSPQLMTQCNVEFDKDNVGISDSPVSQLKFINSERELLQRETKNYLKSSVDRSALNIFQTQNSNLFTNWEQIEMSHSRLRDSSIPKKSINFKSPYSNNNLKDSVTNTPNARRSIQLPQFLTSANEYCNADKNLFVEKFSLLNKTAQDIFDIIFGDQIFQDKITRLAFRNRIGQKYQEVSIEDIDSFFDFLDIKQDQILEVDEVGPVLMQICNYKSKEKGKLIKVFNFFDIDRKGFITRLETEHLLHPQILKKNYYNSALNLSKQLFKEVDHETKGYLTYWELYSCKNSEPVKQLIDIIAS